MSVILSLNSCSCFPVCRCRRSGLSCREGQAPGGRRGEEDQEPGRAAGRDPDEEAGDQVEALRGAGDDHGPREGGARVPATAAHPGKTLTFSGELNPVNLHLGQVLFPQNIALNTAIGHR